MGLIQIWGIFESQKFIKIEILRLVFTKFWHSKGIFQLWNTVQDGHDHFSQNKMVISPKLSIFDFYLVITVMFSFEVIATSFGKTWKIKKPPDKWRALKKLLPLQTSVILLLCIRGLQVKTLKNARKVFFRENIVSSRFTMITLLYIRKMVKLRSLF